MNEDVVRDMVASASCPSCGRQYNAAGIEVIVAGNDIWFLRVVCSACHVTTSVAAILRDGRPALHTDLTAAEVERFQNMATVNEDDLLEMHRFLQDFNGDIPGLFHRDDPSSR